MDNPDDKAALRVAIALDALHQIEIGRLVPERMSYYTRNGRVCRACAMGSLLVGLLDVTHQPLPDKITDMVRGVFGRLRGTFSNEQAAMIEAAFELWEIVPSRGDDFPETNVGMAPMHYGQRHPTQHRRLVAILENIARNGGTFDPRDLREGVPDQMPAMQQACVLDEAPTATAPGVEVHRG